jgi:hypothetical protein
MMYQREQKMYVVFARSHSGFYNVVVKDVSYKEAVRVCAREKLPAFVRQTKSYIDNGFELGLDQFDSRIKFVNREFNKKPWNIRGMS